jgi:hypothetical protein
MAFAIEGGKMKVKITKTWVVAMVWGVFLAVAQAEDAYWMAKAHNIAGKFKIGSCNMFAKDLFRRYEKADKEAYYIVYHWEKMQQNSGSGYHATIVFKDERGRFYAMDNLTHNPVWLRGQTPGEWIEFFSGFNVETKVVSYVATSAVRGETRLALR